MKFELGDVVKNKMKNGSCFMITEVTKTSFKLKGIEGDDDGKIIWVSCEDMWVFKKV